MQASSSFSLKYTMYLEVCKQFYSLGARAPLPQITVSVYAFELDQRKSCVKLSYLKVHEKQTLTKRPCFALVQSKASPGDYFVVCIGGRKARKYTWIRMNTSCVV